MNELTRITLEYNTLKLLVTEKPSEFNAIDIMRLYQKVMQENVNWHEFSDILAHFNVLGLVELKGHNSSGMTIYRMK